MRTVVTTSSADEFSLELPAEQRRRLIEEFVELDPRRVSQKHVLPWVVVATLEDEHVGRLAWCEQPELAVESGDRRGAAGGHVDERWRFDRPTGLREYAPCDLHLREQAGAAR